MTKRTTGVVSTAVLAIALAAFTGSALAGNGKGNGNGNGNSQATPAAEPASSATSSPGNSGNAPGQVKKDSQASTQTQASASGGGRASAPGQANKSGPTGAKGSPNRNSASSLGVKPSNATNAHKPTWAPAGSNRTKLYGNGKTAGQIAMQAGAAPSAMLYGPGNSQPHKYNCGPHYVDVHALKAHLGKCNQQRPSQSVTRTVTCPAVTTTVTTVTPQHGHAYGRIKNGKGLHVQTKTESTTTPTGNVCGSSTTHHPGSPPASTSVFGSIVSTVSAPHGASGSTLAPATSQPSSGVLGAQATSKGKSYGGVLGAVATYGQGALPFTGFPLWVAVLIAAALIVFGVALARRARATV